MAAAHPISKKARVAPRMAAASLERRFIMTSRAEERGRKKGRRNASPLCPDRCRTIAANAPDLLPMMVRETFQYIPESPDGVFQLNNVLFQLLQVISPQFAGGVLDHADLQPKRLVYPGGFDVCHCPL